MHYFENDALTEGWGTNLRAEKTAQNWVKHGFAPEEVCPCLEARCPFPCKAAEPGDKGITPDMATEHYGYDEDDFPMTPGEAYRAGVMNEVLKICLNYGAVVSVLRLEQRHNCVQGATRLCQYTIRQKVISGPTPTERSACNILL